jgi:hypothetical protein
MKSNQGQGINVGRETQREKEKGTDCTDSRNVYFAALEAGGWFGKRFRFKF